jgi:hypothetical protein
LSTKTKIKAALRELLPSPVYGAVRKAFGRVGASYDFWDNTWHAGPDPELERSELGAWFASNEGEVIDKWHHYFEVYERHLSPYRGKPVRMLEIGIQNGGSLEMWRRYFGPDAVLFGIDIDERCRVLDGKSASVRIGSQDDVVFLEDVLDEMGGVDIVLDDGSHFMNHIRTSFETIFPHLSDGGIYLVEDLHTAYWRGYGGGLRRPGTFIETMKSQVDDMHHWYHEKSVKNANLQDSVFAIHFYDSVVAVEKRKVKPPRRSARGRLAQVDSAPLDAPQKSGGAQSVRG